MTKEEVWKKFNEKGWKRRRDNFSRTSSQKHWKRRNLSTYERESLKKSSLKGMNHETKM